MSYVVRSYSSARNVCMWILSPLCRKKKKQRERWNHAGEIAISKNNKIKMDEIETTSLEEEDSVDQCDFCTTYF